MKRLSGRFAWLIVIVAVMLAAAGRLWGNASPWVWVPMALAFLAIGALLGGDDDSEVGGADGGTSSDNGDSGSGGGGD